MKDLSLVFLLTENKQMISFSPISKKFQENQISFPGNAKITSIDTYLTYLYALDSQNNQIYRYPRAEGGFGQFESWLTENVDIKGASQIAIDENIYITEENKIQKFFGGKKEDWKTENSQTPITFSNVLAQPDMNNIYALDSENGRIVIYSKEGKIQKQYSDEKIKEAISFYINESENIAYISTQNKLFYFGL